MPQLKQECAKLGLDGDMLHTVEDFVDTLVQFCPISGQVTLKAFEENLAPATLPINVVFLDVDGVLNTTPRGSLAQGVPNLHMPCVVRFVEVVVPCGKSMGIRNTW